MVWYSLDVASKAIVPRQPGKGAKSHLRGRQEGTEMDTTQTDKATRKAERQEARKTAKYLAQKQARIKAQIEQKPVRSITITIEWVKSRTWGSNPHAIASVTFKDGTFKRNEGYTCSGCGYDKESTVIAQIFNDFLAYKFHNAAIRAADKTSVPYGMYLKREDWVDSYEGGVGTDCYTRGIADFIGGTFKRTANGKTFDVYEYIDLWK